MFTTWLSGDSSDSSRKKTASLHSIPSRSKQVFARYTSNNDNHRHQKHSTAYSRHRYSSNGDVDSNNNNNTREYHRRDHKRSDRYFTGDIESKHITQQAYQRYGSSSSSSSLQQQQHSAKQVSRLRSGRQSRSYTHQSNPLRTQRSLQIREAKSNNRKSNRNKTNPNPTHSQITHPLAHRYPSSSTASKPRNSPSSMIITKKKNQLDDDDNQVDQDENDLFENDEPDLQRLDLPRPRVNTINSLFPSEQIEQEYIQTYAESPLFGQWTKPGKTPSHWGPRWWKMYTQWFAFMIRLERLISHPTTTTTSSNSTSSLSSSSSLTISLPYHYSSSILPSVSTIRIWVKIQPFVLVCAKCRRSLSVFILVNKPDELIHDVQSAMFYFNSIHNNVNWKWNEDVANNALPRKPIVSNQRHQEEAEASLYTSFSHISKSSSASSTNQEDTSHIAPRSHPFDFNEDESETQIHTNPRSFPSQNIRMLQQQQRQSSSESILDPPFHVIQSFFEAMYYNSEHYPSDEPEREIEVRRLLFRINFILWCSLWPKGSILQRELERTFGFSAFDALHQSPVNLPIKDVIGRFEHLLRMSELRHNSGMVAISSTPNKSSSKSSDSIWFNAQTLTMALYQVETRVYLATFGPILFSPYSYQMGQQYLPRMPTLEERIRLVSFSNSPKEVKL